VTFIDVQYTVILLWHVSGCSDLSLNEIIKNEYLLCAYCVITRIAVSGPMLCLYV